MSYKYSLFELIGNEVNFDPPEKDAKKIKEAVEKAKKKQNGLRQDGSIVGEKRKEIEDKLNDLKYWEKEVFTSDWKLNNKEFNEEARKQTQKVYEKLIEQIKRAENPAIKITKAMVKIKMDNTKLSKENVEKAYKEAGFEKSEIDLQAALPKYILNKNFERIYENLEKLRKFDDKNPNAADKTKIKDIYDFIFYLVKEDDINGFKNKYSTISDYRKEERKILEDILNQYSQKYSLSSGVELLKLKQNLATLGKLNVFNSDENRKDFDKFLEYMDSDLPKLFDSMDKSQNPTVVRNYIEKIKKIFTDEITAYAVYNYKAGFKGDNEVHPELVLFNVLCFHCKNLNSFPNQEEAHKVNKCMLCGEKLYKPCKCSKLVLVSEDKCTSCGYVFPDGKKFNDNFYKAEAALRNNKFDDADMYLANALSADTTKKSQVDDLRGLITNAKFQICISNTEEALRKGDFDEAKKNLKKAGLTNPNEKTLISKLENDIVSAEAIYQKPINELKQLTTNKSFQAASEKLTQAIRDFPKLDISVFKPQIEKALTEARRKFEEAKLKPQFECENICVDILESICSDFKPAIEILRNPPEPIKNFNLKIDSKDCFATLEWLPSRQRGVTYRVVRKIGKIPPQNAKDGDFFKDTVNSLYRDENLLAGYWYSYSVFSKRSVGAMNVFSSAVSKQEPLLAILKNAHCEQTDTGLRIIWDKPNNCSGVSIVRSDKSGEIANNIQGTSYEDKNIEENKLYSYMLKANYSDLGSSEIVTITGIFLPKIDQFRIRLERVNDNKYKIMWDIKRKDIDLRIDVYKNDRNTEPIKILKPKSDKSSCEIELPINGFYLIEIYAFSENKWLKSLNDLPLINTYRSCEIDSKESKIIENQRAGEKNSIELHFKLSGTIPKNAVAFWYVVRAKSSSNSPPPWVDSKEIANASDITKVTFDQFMNYNKQEFYYTEIAKDVDSYYVSFFTIYNIGGKEIISSPCKYHFNRPLKANIFWKVSKPFLGDNKLSIVIEANRPFERLPQLILCASQGHLYEYTDANAEILLRTEDKELNVPQKKYENDFIISSKIAKNSKLFLFEANKVSHENFTLRWADGFLGKV